MSDTLIGKKLGDYIIQRLLGRGGMAHVYQGLDPNLQRLAAVKVIDSRLLAKGHEEEYRARFRREARAIAKLTHPNIVGVYQFGEFGPLYYMAMEYIDGEDLHFLLKLKAATQEKLSRAQVLRIVRDIGAALDYAHAGGVIHRDVKPSNIMLRGDDRAVLTDFGLALDVPEGTQGGTFGSAHYIAPEQAISSSNAVPQSDLYSLGVVLYQMMTGKVPFDDSSAMSVALKHLSDAPPPPRLVDPTIPVNVEKVILKALEKEPSKRYKSGAMLYEALADAMGLIDSGSRPSRLFPPSGISEMGTTPKRSSREMQAINAEVSTAELDSSINDAQRTIQFAQDAYDRARRRPMVLTAIGLLVIAILVFGIAALALNGGGGASTPTPVSIALADTATDAAAGLAPTDAPSETPPPSDTPTDEPATDIPTDAPTDLALVIVPTTEEATTAPTVTDAPSDSPSETPGETPSESPSESPVPTETRTRPPTVTRTVEASATLAPTETPVSGELPSAVTPAPDMPTITLRYNPDYLVLLNTSGAAVDISSWTFERLNASNVIIRYASTTWQTDFIDRLPAGDCLMLWRIGIREVEPPDYCRINRAWFAVGQPRFFWVSNTPDSTFEVVRGLQVLATCPTNEGECVVPLNP